MPARRTAFPSWVEHVRELNQASVWSVPLLLLKPCSLLQPVQDLQDQYNTAALVESSCKLSNSHVYACTGCGCEASSSLGLQPLPINFSCWRKSNQKRLVGAADTSGLRLAHTIQSCDVRLSMLQAFGAHSAHKAS